MTAAMLGFSITAQKGVFQASNDDRLVDERIDGASQLAPFGRERLPFGGREARDDQGLEIGTTFCFLLECRRRQVKSLAIAVIFRIPVPRMLTEGPVWRACTIRVARASEAAASPAEASSRNAAIN